VAQSNASEDEPLGNPRAIGFAIAPGKIIGKSAGAPAPIMRMEHHIGGGVYGIKDSQLGDGPMNLPLELQRRFDRRWSARFGVSEQGSRSEPCAAMVSAESRNLEIAVFRDGPNRETPTKDPPSSTAMIDPSVLKPTPN
jgi:hypothetical protein